MSKSSYVLRALKILGLEEMLKLSQGLKQQVSLKKAAGEEFIVWDDVAEIPTTHHQEDSEAKVLEFPGKKVTDLAPLPEEGESSDEDGTSFLSSDLILWQREITRQTGDSVQKLHAFKGYKKSTEMYVIKTVDAEGKDKMRFASTNGVLVNKKQA